MHLTGGTCHGTPAIVAGLFRYNFSTTTTLQLMDLYAMPVNYSQGDWFEPITSPYNPGLQIVVYS